MKKILFAFVILLTASFTFGQTTIQSNLDSTAGYIEQWPAIADIHYDNAGNATDTVYLEGFYDFRAVANPGYEFDHWEVTTVFTKYYDWDTATGSLIEIDSTYTGTITQYNLEYDEDGSPIGYDGWLEWDQGIPDLNDITIEGVSRVIITAYFVPESNTGPVVAKVVRRIY